MTIGKTYREVINAWRGWVGDKADLSSETYWSSRRILFFLNAARVRLLYLKKQSKEMLSKENYQTLDCVELEEVDQVDCPCAPASGCTWLRTKTIIPNTIGGYKSVTTINGGFNYQYADWDKIKHKLCSRIASERTQAYYTLKTTAAGSYIYVYGDNHKKCISVTALFEDPMEIQCYNQEDNCQSVLDLEFKIDPELLFVLYESALVNVLRQKASVTDIVQNNVDDTAATRISSPTLK